MKDTGIPKLSPFEISEFLQKAANSPRRRYPKILHKPGDKFNRVINFMMEDTYMQPHLHPSEEKIEKIYLVQGKFAILVFNDQGNVEIILIVEKGKTENVEIPAFTWHTYVMLSENVVTYETMMGKYYPETWKTFAYWAPDENTKKSIPYLNELKQKAIDY